LLCASTFTPVFSQEVVSDSSEIIENEAAEPEVSDLPQEDDRIFVIDNLEFDITGKTRPYALIYNGEFKIGETFTGQENLEEYIRDKTQVLINQRVLKDNVVITYSVGEQQEDETYPVTLLIKVEDSWNLIALPRPAYSSNTGFEFTIKARDYNFLGTMSPLRVDLGYKYDENKHSSFQFEVYSDTPFRAFGFTWYVKFDNLFWYRYAAEEPFYYRNNTGLAMELPFRRTTFTFGFFESFIYNEENDEGKKEIYNVDFQKGLYMATNLYANWKIPTGLMVHRFGELTYTPGISAIFNHEINKWPLQDFLKGPFLNFNHSLGFERIDWKSNFRDGLSVFIDNDYTYDFFRSNNDLPPLSSNLSIRGAGYFIITDFFSITSQLQYRHWFYHDPDYYLYAGDMIRGIADKAIKADYMLSLNMDFPFRVFLFMPSKWLKKEKLRFFDFELQISPIIDIALYHDPKAEVYFHPRNTAFTGGVEIFVFPFSFRSLYIRLGYALNLREFFATGKRPTSNNREIYLIMRHFY